MNPLLPDELLKSLGILDWGYTEEPLATSFEQFQQWSTQGQHGPLNYLVDHRQNLRQDVRLVYPDFQSAVVFLFSYQETKKWMLEQGQHELAAYALGFEGADYHQVLKHKLQSLFSQLQQSLPTLECMPILDTQPILERDLAYRAGLGWFGKNSMLISRQHGSYFIIGSLLLNQKLPIPSTATDSDHCGHCQACAEACPTDAIDLATRTLRARDCISTFTIEIFKAADPPAGFADSRGEIFGCDICQDVCPWNHKPLQRVTSLLKLTPELKFLKEWFYQLPKAELLQKFTQLSGRGLRKALKGTALERPGREGWLKNLRARLSASQNDF
jgi:epoxyqueuosine reductase